MSRSASIPISGCDSGWTFYLDQSSSFSTEQCKKFFEGRNCMVKGGKAAQEDDNDDNEEDSLSMLSDATSGPPYDGKNEFSARCSCSARGVSKTKNSKNTGTNRHDVHYDDTAASTPPLSSPKNSSSSNYSSVARRKGKQDNALGLTTERSEKPRLYKPT